MTRATNHMQQPSVPTHHAHSRSHGNLHQRSFKKSHSRDRNALAAISLNHRNHSNAPNAMRRRKAGGNTNPFTSFQPNKSGIISRDDEQSDEPSDFSRFLSPPKSPRSPVATDALVEDHENIACKAQPPQPQAAQISNGSSSISPNDNQSNFVSSQSRSNQNVTLKESKHVDDDWISAGLQRYNSMTVPFVEAENNNNHQTANGNQHQHHAPHPNRVLMQNTQTMPVRSMSDSNLQHTVQRHNEYYNQLKLEYIPFDWCLKRTLYFVSDQPLDWCSNISLKIRNAAMHRVPLQSLNLQSAFEEKQYEFYKNMIYYQYPHTQWEQSQLAILHKYYLKNASNLKPLEKAKDKNQSAHFGIVSNSTQNLHHNHNNHVLQNYEQHVYNLFIDRMHEWMESFHSLYASYRLQFCRYIYIHFANFFNIIFCFDRSEDGKHNPRVIITNTHQSFRNNLKKHNIVFSTPLVKNKCTEEPLRKRQKTKHVDKENEHEMEQKDGEYGTHSEVEDDDDALDLEELQRSGLNIRMNRKRKANGMGFEYNNRDRTATLIEGKQNVHHFYDYLINNMHRLCLSMKKCHDVPLLFCNQTFLNSKCCLISMSKNVSGFDTNTQQKVYSMQLDGSILPNIQHSVMNLLFKSQQSASITCYLYDKMMAGVNYCANNQLFKRLKDEENKTFTAMQKVQINGKEKHCAVYLQ